MDTQSPPLMRFRADDTQTPTCGTCGAGSPELQSTTLYDLSLSASSGCQFCSLRYLGILKVMHWGTDLAASTMVSVELRNARITVYVIRDRYRSSPSVESVRPGQNYFHLELYTRFGERTCSWPMVAVGRDIADSRELTYLNIISEWIHTCTGYHSDCPKGETLLPSRVLDVGTDASDKVYLHVSNGEFASYVALSHCWGGKVPTQTTRENYTARRKGTLFHDFPKTFRDAIVVTRNLGVRYLWIDALCIVQDDKDDWESESGNMAAIYSKAYVVIGADMSKDSHGGFLQAQSGNHSISVPVAIICDPEGSDSTVYVRKVQLHRDPFRWDDIDVVVQPLALRAWTLQEQLLATRMVHFTSTELIWECSSAFCCECMELDKEDRMRYSNAKMAYHKCLTSPKPAERFSAWHRIAHAFMSRGITSKLDRLPALSGMVRQIHDSGGGAYLASLWREDLPRSLMWEGGNELTRRVVPYGAPSWSWACLESSDGHSHSNFFNEGITMDVVMATVLEAMCKSNERDPFGAVSSGYIKLSAPLLKVSWMLRSKKSLAGYRPNQHYILMSLDRATSLQAYASIDFGPELDKDTTLQCLFIGMENPVSGRPSILKGLVLQRNDGADTFERVGTFDVGGYYAPEDPTNFLKGSVETTVVIT